MTYYEFSLTENINLDRVLDPTESFNLSDETYLLFEYLFGLDADIIQHLMFSSPGEGLSNIHMDIIVPLVFTSNGVGLSDLHIDIIVPLVLSSDGVGESDIDLSIFDLIDLEFAPSDGVGESDLIILNFIPVSFLANGVGGGTSLLRRQVDLFPSGAGQGEGNVVEVYLFDLKPRLWKAGRIPCRVPVDSRRIPKKC